MQYLKADTETKVVIGPVVAVGDGFTPVTTLSLSTADEAEMLKHDASAVTDISGNTFAAITGADGYYNLTLTAAQLDTEGRLTILINDDSLCLPVRHDFIVQNANVFDSLHAAAATDYLQTDVTQVSSSATAADNLEFQYDGTTGLTGDTFPSTQLQVGGIATGAGGISAVADSFTLTTGTQSAGTVTSTEAKDGTVHTIVPATSIIDCYYEFDIGVNGKATEIIWDGYVGNNSDNVEVFGYDWVSASFKQVGTIAGKNANTVEEQIFIFTNAMTGTGANAGKVRCQFKSDGADVAVDLNTDRILCEYTQLASGIPNGSTITLSSSAANSNLIGYGWTLALGGQDITGAYVNKAVDVTGIATGTNGSPFTFQECNLGTVSLDAFGFIEGCAMGGTVTLTSTSGVTADSISFFNSFSGVAGTGSPTITAAGVTKTTNVQTRNWFGGITGVLNSDTVWSHEVPSGGTQTFTNVGGQLELRGNPKAVNLTTSGSAVSNIVVGNGCSVTISGTGGTVNLYGDVGNVVNTSTGTTVEIYAGDTLFVGTASGTPSTTVFDLGTSISANDVYNDTVLMFTSGNAAFQPRPILDHTTTQITVSEPFTVAPASGDNFAIYRDHIHPTAQIADAVWDDTATRNVANSPGKRLRQLEEGVISAESSVNDVSASTTSFVTNLSSAVDDFYNDKILVFTDGALAGQSRVITGYNGTTKAVTFDEATTSAPADATQFIILAMHQHSVAQIQSGLATSAALATVDTNVDAILVDTGTTLPGTLSSMDTKLDTIDTNVDTILVDTGTTLEDGFGYVMTILAGAISNADNAAEAYTFTYNGTAYAVTYAGLDADGNRGTTVLSKP